MQMDNLKEHLPPMPDIPQEAFEELPIWQLPPQALAFTCERSTAKQLAQVLLDTLMPMLQAV